MQTQIITERTEMEATWWTDRRMPPVVSVEDSAGFVNILAAHVERAPLLDLDPDLDDRMEPRTWL